MNIIAAILIALAVSLYSDDSEAITNQDIVNECTRYQNYASAIMTDRQNGVDINIMLESSNGNKQLDDLIMRAYKEPFTSASSVKTMFIDRFADQAWVRCMRYYETNKD